MTRAATDVSSTAWGGMLRVKGDLFQAGGELSSVYVPAHVNAKEPFALQALLLEFCRRSPRQQLRRAQVLADVDNYSVPDCFATGRSRKSVTHTLASASFG